MWIPVLSFSGVKYTFILEQTHSLRERSKDFVDMIQNSSIWLHKIPTFFLARLDTFFSLSRSSRSSIGSCIYVIAMVIDVQCVRWMLEMMSIVRPIMVEQ